MIWMSERIISSAVVCLIAVDPHQTRLVITQCLVLISGPSRLSHNNDTWGFIKAFRQSTQPPADPWPPAWRSHSNALNHHQALLTLSSTLRLNGELWPLTFELFPDQWTLNMSMTSLESTNTTTLLSPSWMSPTIQLWSINHWSALFQGNIAFALSGNN